MDIIIEAKDIVKTFKLKKQSILDKQAFFTAVDRVSVRIPRKKTVGVVGESGSGKSTFAEIVGNLQQPTSGEILYYGKNIKELSKAEYKKYRSNVQFIFQSAKESLNPFFSVKEVLMEPLKIASDSFDMNAALHQIKEMLHRVKLEDSILSKHATEISGGQAQRVAIARSLLLRPQLIVCDESVSALDVSVQKQILDLLLELQRELEISYLFITHDIGVVNYMSDSIMVMKHGKMVEQGTKEEVLFAPKDDYTQTLVSSSFLFDKENHYAM